MSKEESVVISRRLLLNAVQAINYYLEPKSPKEHEQTMNELWLLLAKFPPAALPVERKQP